MEPRIYTYKITFPSQGWWYWGVHKERKYGEEYWGSLVTKRCRPENSPDRYLRGRGQK